MLILDYLLSDCLNFLTHFIFQEELSALDSSRLGWQKLV